MITAAIAIFIATAETLAEVVVVVVLANVIAVIAIVSVLIGVGILVTRRPAILPRCLSRLVTLSVSIVHGLAKRVRAVLISFVVTAAAVVTIDRRCVVIRIGVVVS